MVKFVQIRRQASLIYECKEIGHGITNRAVQLRLQQEHPEFECYWEKNCKFSREKVVELHSAFVPELLDVFVNTAPHGGELAQLKRDLDRAVGVRRPEQCDDEELLHFYKFYDLLVEDCARILCDGGVQMAGGQVVEGTIADVMDDADDVKGINKVVPLLGNQFTEKEKRAARFALDPAFKLSADGSHYAKGTECTWKLNSLLLVLKQLKMAAQSAHRLSTQLRLSICCKN